MNPETHTRIQAAIEALGRAQASETGQYTLDGTGATIDTAERVGALILVQRALNDLLENA